MVQAGVDEVGRGCLAGPVVAAAVILFNEVEGLKDSKQLTPIKRNSLCNEILKNGISGIGISSNIEVDEINIHKASLLAMERAISNLEVKPSNIFVDGGFGLNIDIPNHPIIGGDKKCFLISAASIVAKVYRDNLMHEMDREYPGFNFSKHKGYPTAQHLNLIKELGPSKIHRMTFKGVK
jgi:ribonuclease HII